MIQIGISTASLFPRRATEDALQKIGGLGADCAEVFFSTFYEYRPEFSKAVAAAGPGVQINSVHANSVNFEGNFFNSTRRVRGDGMYWLDQLCRSAQLLGCKNYTFHGFHRMSAGGGENFDVVASRLAEAADFAAGYGVRLCLENVCWALYNRPGVFAELKRRIPGLCGVFDIKQARRSHYPWQAYLKDMSGSVAYAHLSDVNAEGRLCLPGAGLCDFGEVFRRLRGEGFEGAAIIEVYGGDYGDESELARSVEYLKELACKLF